MNLPTFLDITMFYQLCSSQVTQNQRRIYIKTNRYLYIYWFSWHYYTTKLLIVISLWLNFHIRENLWVERERLQVELWWCWWGVKGTGGGSYFIYLDKGKPLDVPFCIREKDEQTGLGRKTAFICLTLCKKQDF